MSKSISLTVIAAFLATIAVAQEQEKRASHKGDSSLMKWNGDAAFESKSDSKLDTLQQKLKSGEQHLNTLTVDAKQAADSLKPDFSRYQLKLDSVKGKLRHRIDSLKKLSLPTEEYTHLLDSINQAGPMRDIRQAATKLKLLESKMNEPVNKMNKTVSDLERKINDPLNVLKIEGGSGANLPGSTNLPEVKLPGTSAFLLVANPPSTSLSGISHPPEQVNARSTQVIEPVTGLNGASEANSVNGVGSGAQQELNELKSGSGLGDVQKSLAEMKQVSGKVESYSKDVRNISKGNLDSTMNVNKELEQRVMKMDELKGLQQNQLEVDKYKGMIGQGNDREALRKLAMQQVPKEAMNHFAGKEQVLQQAMSKLASFKNKYNDLKALKDTLKRPPNPMHGKPLIERLVPGLTLQFMKTKDVMVDINPSLSYRVTGRLNLGLGWVERFTIQDWQLRRMDKVYGVRYFSEFRWKKGIYFRLDAENLNMQLPADPSLPTDQLGRGWGWNLLAGAKKDFHLLEGVRGNVQTLYRFWSKNGEAPYPDRLTVRIGFEFPFKKKQ